MRGWYLYWIKGKVRKYLHKILNINEQKMKHYNGKKMLMNDEFQRELIQRIQSGKPFAVARFGSVELRCIVEDEKYDKLGDKCYSAKTLKSMQLNAGFFPSEGEMLHKFSIYIKVISEKIDWLGVWYNFMEDYIVKNYMDKTQLVHLRALEPYYYSLPWSSALEGKKVLVIHPFEESIREQYEKREQIWGHKEVLPAFELKTLKAVQTAGGEKDSRFQDWFEALEYLKRQIAAIDFDIAILGCGAYGFPLAVYIKELGKQAIHLGGATQILFGIQGKRWDQNSIVTQFYNEAWIRPKNGERPTACQQIEDGCYW